MREDGPPSKGLEREVFDHWLSGWRRTIGGTRAPALDAKRRRKIRARLADQFTPADLKRAIDGLWASSWHIENGRTDIELVCRDASHVERFMGLLAPTSALPLVNEASSPAPAHDAFVPPPAKLFEVMESVRRAFSPPDDSSGAPVLWKARPRPGAEVTNRGARVG
ncbi:hypothetical protein LVJ94_17575 [Pendulispora rubella]|uniref:Uncharacterized protein n=1 Tax=Pendulispora rubella TaxID=2741070 RepID=A0ABZ2LIQ3_9BACT